MEVKEVKYMIIRRNWNAKIWENGNTKWVKFDMKKERSSQDKMVNQE